MGWDRSWRTWRAAELNRRGAVDVTDLVVGLVLLVGIPTVCVFGVGMYQQSGEQPLVEPDAHDRVSREEIVMRTEEAKRLLYSAKATHFFLMEGAEELGLRDHYRKWAKNTLQECLVKIRDIQFLIEQQPAAAQWSDLLASVDRLEQQAETLQSQL